MSKLTSFQIRCEDALAEMLEFHSKRLVSREINEDGEPYVHLVVEGDGIEVWLYDDEAEFHAGRRRRNYEAAVFRDEADRVASFVKDLEAELS